MASEKDQDQQEQQQQQPAADQQQQAPTTNEQPPPAEETAVQNQAPQQQQQQPPASPQQQQQQSQRPRSAVHKSDYEKDTVYLYQFSRTAKGPFPSPFCLKLECWLRINAIKYENVDHFLKYKSKKGTLPFVELNGNEIADSVIIVRELTKYFGKELDASLTSEQRHMSHAMCIMLDHHTGWVNRWWVYNHPGEYMKSFKLNGQHMLNSRIPSPILNFFIKMKLKGNKKKAQAHGLGVHSPEEIYEFGKADLLTLEELIGDKPFFFGDEPTLLDCVAFGHLVPVLGMSSSPFPFKEFLETECSHLLGLVERIKERYWPDWEEMSKTLDLNTHIPKKKEEEQPQDEKDNKEKEKNGGEKEKSGSGTPDEKDKESEPEKEKIEKDEKEKEKEKDKEVEEEGDNKQKEGMEEKMEDNKKE